MAAIYEVFKNLSTKFERWDGHSLEDGHQVSNVIKWAVYGNSNGGGLFNSASAVESIDYVIAALEHAKHLIESEKMLK